MPHWVPCLRAEDRLRIDCLQLSGGVITSLTFSQASAVALAAALAPMSQAEPDPGSSCPIRPPQHAARLLPRAAQRPFDVATWSSANVTALQCPCRSARCPKIFQPCGSSSYDNGDWDEAIRSSQFPAKCDRFLLVKIDLPNAGLGMLSRVLASALLLAVRENRVLIEMPLNGSTELPRGAFHLGRAPGKGMTSSPPWCDRAPYTLQCFYLPSTSWPASNAPGAFTRHLWFSATASSTLMERR